MIAEDKIQRVMCKTGEGKWHYRKHLAVNVLSPRR